MSEHHFWILCEDLKKTGLHKKIPDLSLPTLALIFQARFRQNATNELLGSLIHESKPDIIHKVWEVIFSYFHSDACCPTPKMWVKPDLTIAEKNQKFMDMIANYDDLMAPLARLFADPLKKKRQGYFLLIDSTKIPVIKSSDAEFQKKMFASHRLE